MLRTIPISGNIQQFLSQQPAKKKTPKQEKKRETPFHKLITTPRKHNHNQQHPLHKIEIKT